ncbi:DarT ssDNA thymidine ADP-ribosyltransferase family protein [Bacillus piscicola]|uniref:DarT ssDNA thymidine ADP-ribosyltransferase family protein n=1 Tax=Bacillus piscicola TaxID=1632684 RepID=UPI001F09DDB3|nr:DarT ssDNA thymidine ADP-ribosyltransferase family protein [Bacillus piscicola]
MENIKDQKLLYHLTRLSNLESILKYGLLSRKRIGNNDLTFSDVADPDIISKRTLLGLQDYVPFHFHPYSAFDKAVKSKHSDEEFIYICIKRELARKNDFKILPKHPLADEKYKLYHYDEGFEAIDWDVMHTPGNETEHKKHVKMAECLTHKRIHPKYFQCIYVKSEETRKWVQQKLKEHGVTKKPPFVDIGKWFDI